MALRLLPTPGKLMLAVSAAAGMSLVPCRVNRTLMWFIRRSCIIGIGSIAAAGEDIEERSPLASSKVAEESPRTRRPLVPTLEDLLMDTG